MNVGSLFTCVGSSFVWLCVVVCGEKESKLNHFDGYTLWPRAEIVGKCAWKIVLVACSIHIPSEWFLAAGTGVHLERRVDMCLCLLRARFEDHGLFFTPRYLVGACLGSLARFLE